MPVVRHQLNKDSDQEIDFSIECLEPSEKFARLNSQFFRAKTYDYVKEKIKLPA